jgi:hypothetical protein
LLFGNFITIWTKLFVSRLFLSDWSKRFDSYFFNLISHKSRDPKFIIIQFKPIEYYQPKMQLQQKSLIAIMLLTLTLVSAIQTTDPLRSMYRYGYHHHLDQQDLSATSNMRKLRTGKKNLFFSNFKRSCIKKIHSKKLG